VRERCEADQVEQRIAYFSRRELRKRLGWSATQVRVHLERLRELDYIAARHGRPGAAFHYELLTDCAEAAVAVPIGLLDVEKLRVAAKLPSEDAKVRQATCRENHQPDGGCRGGPRQVQVVAESALKANLTA
jgi:hypothetical protein